jgi:E3 ubiquitin-protein ligase EDD1
LALFSEDDSDDSTQQEDEDDEEDESDGNESDDRDTAVAGASAAGTGGAGGGVTTTGTAAASSASGANVVAPSGSTAGTAGSSAANTDDFNIVSEEQIFERRPTSGVQRGNLAPLSMQWAIRTREPPTIRSSTASGLVFIDHTSGTMRRSAASSAVAAAAAAAASNHESVTMATTASGLARAFGIIMRYANKMLKDPRDVYQSLYLLWLILKSSFLQGNWRLTEACS